MMRKKILALFMSIIMLATLMPAAYANENAAVTIESATGAPGSTVNVAVSISGNPGILGATLTLKYDSVLTLVNATSGDAFSALTFTKPGKFQSPCNFLWDAQELAEGDIKDGTILNLQFAIDEDAAANSEYKIELSYLNGDILDKDTKAVDLTINNGTVYVVDYIPGDINDDTRINSGDIIFLRRHIAGGYDVTINEKAGDVNANGRLDTGDIINLRRYIAGGYGVELMPAKPACTHSMEKTEYKAPTCTDDGNIEYWTCSLCGKIFMNEEGTSEIAADDVAVSKTGHTVVIDEAVAPTYDSTGLTEGKHCSVCNEVLLVQTVVPKLEATEYSITYHIDDNDTYLQSIVIENPNPLVYSKETGLTLKNLSVNGYKFLGWYTMQSGGTQVTQIAAGETGNKELYAHWEKETYTISFASDMQPIETITYQTGESKVLPKPALDKYTFVGWTDNSGKVWDSVPAGTFGNITLYANWASNRNKAEAVENLGDPLIFEDSENGLILFTYEIGQIKNVPLFTTLRLQTANGIISTIEKTETEEISETQAKTIAQTISNATTNSSSWTLSKDWNSTTEVSQAYIDQTGQTREEVEKISKSTTDTYNLSKSAGGSSGGMSTSGGSYNISANSAHSNTTTEKSGNSIDLSVDAKYTHENSVGAEAKVEVEKIPGLGSASAGVNAGMKDTFEIGAGADYNQYKNKETVGTNNSSLSQDFNSYFSNTSTSEKNWNTTSGYSSSTTTSVSQTIANIFSKVITEQYGYGESYSEGGSNSEAKALASTDSKSDEFSSTLTYHTAKITSTTESFQSTGNTMGGYRMVMAGTVHVFAVVGYDIPTASYFVYTYNVLDDHTEEYLDYSFDETFNDYETSIIPFEVPSFVNDYVNAKIAKTDGLTLDVDTGTIVDYTPTGSNPDQVVVIPSYIRVDNNDGTYKSVKVKGIADGLFKNNTDIEIVQLGGHITEIPESAFEGCSNLRYIIAPGVEKIGAKAFSGCTSLEPFTVPKSITELGENAFTDVPEIEVVASNADIARNSVAACADELILDISALGEEEIEGLNLEVGNISSFELRGKDKEYKGLSVKSDAGTTVINGITFTESTKIPMIISSENVTLDKVAADSKGFALVLTAENTELTLNRTINLTSLSENSVLCKNIELKPLTVGVVGKLSTDGNVLICGEVTNDKYLNFTDGEIITITEEEFNKYLSNSMIIFDANGGECDTEFMYVANGNAVGELPVPTKEGERFLGWYTEDGELIDADTVLDDSSFINVSAKWEISTFTASWTEGSGYTIAVERTESPYQNADLGTVANGDNVYFGDVLSVTYSAKTGYNLTDSGKTSITVAGDVTSDDIYASASVKQFTASWTVNTGCNITVKRTSSPYQGATTGTLSSGAVIYYGDVLSVSYSANTNYNLLTKGQTSITVTGNVDGSKIYATAEHLGTWYANINGMDDQAERIKYNLDFYYEGTNLHIKGYIFEIYNNPSTPKLDVSSRHVRTTHTSNSKCPCGQGSGCTHGIDWWIEGFYDGGVPTLHTWASGYPDPIRLD